jgi:hypothetical protein
MKRLLMWTAGLAVGLWVVNELREAGLRLAQKVRKVDLNTATRESLLTVPGLTETLVDRIIDNRPYRHRLDLVARMVVPSGIYQTIRERVDVDGNTALKTVNFAS